MGEARLDARIMILDDEPLIAMTTEQMMLDFGYTQVDVFCRLEEAERASQTHTYDMAVLDVNVDGNRTSLDLARTLESIRNTRGVRDRKPDR